MMGYVRWVYDYGCGVCAWEYDKMGDVGCVML